MASDYDGPVVFVDGVHYPATEDGADLDTPLRRNDTNDGWRVAEDDDPLHNDVHHATEAELPVGGEN